MLLGTRTLPPRVASVVDAGVVAVWLRTPPVAVMTVATAAAALIRLL